MQTDKTVWIMCKMQIKSDIFGNYALLPGLSSLALHVRNAMTINTYKFSFSNSNNLSRPIPVFANFELSLQQICDKNAPLSLVYTWRRERSRQQSSMQLFVLGFHLFRICRQGGFGTSDSLFKMSLVHNLGSQGFCQSRQSCLEKENAACKQIHWRKLSCC